MENHQFEYSTLQHALSLFSIPLNMLAIYCIIFKSTNYMRNYKWYLLNVQIWVFSTDLILLILISPRFYFPLIAGTVTGLFSLLNISFGIQTIIGFGTGVGMIAASVHAIQYRHSQILPPNSFFWNHPNFGQFLSVIRYVILGGVAVPAVLNEPKNQLEAKIRVEKIHPQSIPSFFFENRVYLLQESPILIVVPGLFVIIYVSMELFYYVSYSFRQLRNKASHMANRTRKLQSKYFVCICVQVFVPAIFCLTPIAFLCYAIALGHLQQHWNDIAVITFSLHGIIATTFMLLLYQPYRLFCIRLFVCQSQKPSEIHSVKINTREMYTYL